MSKIRVDQGGVDRSLTNTLPEQPMRWAKLKSNGEATYIGWLRGDQNGDACGCKCPACGEDLQAVNVDKDATHFLKANTRGKFFRHPSGHQRKDCSFLMSKLAALHLLMESSEIDLPSPRQTGIYRGASGSTYTSEAMGHPWRGRITNKVWLDSQSATIVVDGRTILVQLEARPILSSELAFDGVIIIRVDDPTVASWEPAQILKALQLDGGFTCWEKHWDDEALSAEAQQKAMAAAEAAMDRIPPELGTLEGLSFLQKSESVLHAKVKEILSRSGRLRVPRCEQEVSRWMHDGSQRTLTAHVDSQNLTLTEVRLETHLQGLVPDVICTARSSRNPSESFPLLVEVAVTHRVDSAKKALITNRGLACIEIDLTLLSTEQRRITVDQLQSAVIDDVACKSWVFNPALERIMRSKEQELAREDEELRKAWLCEEERQQWLETLSTERLIELLLPALQHHWLTEGAVRIDDKYDVLPQEIAVLLARRGFKDAQDPALLEKEGILHCLDNIRGLHPARRSLGKWDSLVRLAEAPSLQKYLTLGLIAIRTYPLDLLPQELDRVNGLRKRVKDSLDSGQRTFARPDTHDKLVSALFPPMRAAVSKSFGTLKDLKKKMAERQADEQQKAIAVWREGQIAIEKRRKQLEEKEVHWRRMEDLLAREHVYRWKPETVGSSIETVLRQVNVARLIRNYSRSGLDVEVLLRSAWVARRCGSPIAFWLREQPEQDASKEILMLEALRVAGLV